MKSYIFLSKRTFGIVIICMFFSMLLSTSMRGASVKAEVKELGGIPTLFINNNPQGPMAYRRNTVDSEHMGELAQLGQHVYWVTCNAEYYQDRRQAAYNVLDQEIKELLRIDPSAWIILAPWFPVLERFANDYPDELQKFDDGTTVPSGGWTKPSNAGVTDPYLPRYSLVSQVFKAQYEEALQALISHVGGASYSDRVIGYFILAGGDGGGWLYWSDFDYANRCMDFSLAMITAFRNWLGEKYDSNVNLLQDAWDDNTVTFNNAMPPSLIERSSYSFGYFYNPEVGTDQKVLDYYQCQNEVMVDTMTYLSQVVKTATDNNAIVGFYYSFIGENMYYSLEGASIIKKLLDASTVDALMSPPTYLNRDVGNHITLRNVTGSLKLANKLFIVENDTRTCFGSESQRTYGAPDNLADTLSILWRDFSNNLTNGVNAWWFEMESGWYDHPDIKEAFAQMQKLGRLGLKYDSRISNAQIAVIYDSESIFTAGSLEINRNLLWRMDALELGRIGVLPDEFEIGDITNPKLQEYKMYIFMNAFSLTDVERQNIDTYLKKDNKVLIWIYAPGIINPDAVDQLSINNMEDLTGIQIDYDPGELSLDMTVTNTTHDFTSGLPVNYEFGSFTRPITSGIGHTPENPGLLAPVKGDPRFYVQDPQVTALAQFTGTNRVGYAVKEFANWTSVYIGSMAAPSRVLRAIAEYAGVHLYVNDDDFDDIVYQNDDFLAIHTAVGGVRTISLPFIQDVYDLIDDTVIAENVSSFNIDIPAGCTKLFYLGSLANLEAKQKELDIVDDGTRAFWHIDDGAGGIIYDSYSYNNGTINGGAMWTAGISGTALEFDGNDDYVEVADSDSLDFVDGVTIESWVYWHGGLSPGTNGHTIVAKGTYNLCATYWGYKNSANQWQLLTYPDLRSLTNQWVHVVATKEGSVMKVYVNGNLAATKTDAVGDIAVTSDNLMIGYKYNWGAGWYFDGVIDEARIYDRALSLQEIKEHYSQAAFWSFDEGILDTVYDNAAYANNGTINGGAMWAAGISGTALEFDGNDDYVEVADSDSLDLVDGVTIESWVYWHGGLTPGTNGHTIVSKGTYNLCATYWGYKNSANQWQLLIYPDLRSLTNQWVHVVATKEGSVMKVYVNGNLAATKTDAAGDIAVTSDKLMIGYKYNWGAGWYFDGVIDEARIYNRVLSLQEIKTRHEFMSMRASWKMDEDSGPTIYDETENENHGTINSGALWAVGISGAALEFDGDDDYVEVADSDSLGLVDSVTIESWVYWHGGLTPGTNGHTIVAKGTYNLCATYWAYKNNANQWQILTYADLRSLTNQWVYIVATKEGSVMKVYVNGDLVATKTDAVGDIAVTSDNLMIGYKYNWGAGWYFDGVIDETRIYDRVLGLQEIETRYDFFLNL